MLDVAKSNGHKTLAARQQTKKDLMTGHHMSRVSRHWPHIDINRFYATRFPISESQAAISDVARAKNKTFGHPAD